MLDIGILQKISDVRQRGQARQDDLEEALPRLPEVFDKRDIARVLGYTPPYTTLARALEALEASGEIVDTQEFGYRRSYRKASTS